MKVIIDRFWDYRTKAEKSQAKLEKKDRHIGQVERMVVDQSKNIVDLI